MVRLFRQIFRPTLHQKSRRKSQGQMVRKPGAQTGLSGRSSHLLVDAQESFNICPCFLYRLSVEVAERPPEMLQLLIRDERVNGADDCSEASVELLLSLAFFVSDSAPEDDGARGHFVLSVEPRVLVNPDVWDVHRPRFEDIETMQFEGHRLVGPYRWLLWCPVPQSFEKFW